MKPYEPAEPFLIPRMGLSDSTSTPQVLWRTGTDPSGSLRFRLVLVRVERKVGACIERDFGVAFEVLEKDALGETFYRAADENEKAEAIREAFLDFVCGIVDRQTLEK